MSVQQPPDKSYFILPDLGEGVHEAELIKWRVKPGERVDEHQTLAEMETDKALVEVPSPWSGVIKELHGREGEVLTVGSRLVSYDVAGAAAPAPAAARAASVESGEDAGTVVGNVSSEFAVPAQFARRATETPAKAPGKSLATPAVRRLARELGVDINQVSGTGRGGRVTASDLQSVVGRVPAGPEAPTIPPAAPPALRVSVASDGVVERIPIRGVRRTIAQALDHSVRTAVHFTVVDEADVTALDRKRKEYSAVVGRKLSFLPFVLTAVCRALQRHPRVNANVDDAKGEILIKKVINLGCAVDTDHGLMVPVINEADRLSLVQLADAVSEVARACRDRTIERERLIGGTFTISNVGSFGGLFSTPIINYPEVAILGVGRATERVLTRDGQFFAGKVLPLSLSCDHRVVDGAEGARFLATVRGLLESPSRLVDESSG